MNLMILVRTSFPTPGDQYLIRSTFQNNQLALPRSIFSHAPTRVFMRVGEELREITRRGASSRCAVTESSSEDNLSTLHTTFTQQPVSSEQILENLDSFPSSIQSHLAASHDSGSSLPPRPSRIGQVSLLAIDEGERIVDPPTFTGRGLHCEISNRRCLPDPRPLAPTVGRRRTEEEGVNLESEEEEGGNFESDEEEGNNLDPNSPRSG